MILIESLRILERAFKQYEAQLCNVNCVTSTATMYDVAIIVDCVCNGYVLYCKYFVLPILNKFGFQ